MVGITPIANKLFSDAATGTRVRNAGPAGQAAGMLSLQAALGVFACVSSVAASCGTVGHLQECMKIVCLLCENNTV